MKNTIFNIHSIVKILLKINNKIEQYIEKYFFKSSYYWRQRYKFGGNSGSGSYNKLAMFKANIINSFVEDNSIKTVIEFGCGDGNQLRYAKYDHYIGFDISPHAIEICRKVFSADPCKSFLELKVHEDIQKFKYKAELTLSLDVIFHLVEDVVFDKYMSLLFESSKKFVCIYSSNSNNNEPDQAPHVRHRVFSLWVEKNQPNWQLIKMIPNIYPYNGDDGTTSFSDFYFYKNTVNEN
ncbi:hypothetical protein NIES2100_16040 [Calothrix sp. NIES-2100]|uniref:class I SAM-dependent methyltransferase n=1 Tax=Calothrix sp. NIES-2100 TaxID=1954172 RepID=UPI000B5EC9B0|nr:hypothetical protein NIES2100_16040 [Calothrix sp. NIES-2100]